MKQVVPNDRGAASAKQAPSGVGVALVHPMQRKIDGSLRQCSQQNRLSQLKSQPPRSNGLPPQLRTGIETLSGMDMGDVVVHRNSAKPARMNALAYAQGNDIHLGPGQEKHLSHEAWHVVQQRQGRVRATTQLGATPVNDDSLLEREADAMGGRAIQMKVAHLANHANEYSQPATHETPLQLKWISGARPGLLMWDLPMDGVQWYFKLETGKMFYSSQGNITREKSREEWLEAYGRGDPLAREDASIIDVNTFAQSEAYSKSRGSQKQLVVEEVAASDARIETASKAMGLEWERKGGNPDKHKEDHQCSGDKWTQDDEGADVGRDLALAEYREKLRHDQYQRTFIARYVDSDEAIAVMIIEMRREDNNYDDERPPGEEYLYIRWLLASPSKRGGGSALVEQAKVVSANHSKGDLRVDSARSATDWYEKQAFKVLYAAAHETKEECGCQHMVWKRASA
jgi:hypothetical protein